MELNDIKIFVELYNNRSISKTAEKLNYTQSNVSTRLMKLEQEFNLHTTSPNKVCRNFSNNIFDIIITHTELDSSIFTRFEKTEILLWVSSVNYKNQDNELVNIIINRDKLCPLRRLSMETTHSLNSKFSLIEVDTLDLMLSLVYTSNCIALLPQKLIENDMGLVPYDLLPPKMLDIFLYSHQEIDMEILTDCFIRAFSFNKSSSFTVQHNIC